MTYTLCKLSEEHGSEVMAIFNHYIENSMSAYFETPLPTAFVGKLIEITKGYSSLVVKSDCGKVVGFGFMHAYHPASSLRRTAELTYFIAPEHNRQGLGGMLLRKLIESAQEDGIDNLVASVSSENAESLHFHKKFGFVERGRLKEVGKKFGKDFDIVTMQRKI